LPNFLFDQENGGTILGDGEFVHASSKHGVIKNKLSKAYYAKRYVTSVRIFNEEDYLEIIQ
jgi:hypothetical protein